MTDYVFDLNNNVHPPKQFELIFFMFLLQVTYLLLTVIEADNDVNTYGIVAGCAMTILGLTFLICSAVRLYGKRHFNTDIIFEIMEGVLYTTLGATLAGIRFRRQFS